jgi:hypothetical protein
VGFLAVLAEAFLAAPAAGFFAVERDVLAAERLAAVLPAPAVLFAADVFAAVVRLAVEVPVDRDVDLEPPLLACGISLSPGFEVGVHTIFRHANAQSGGKIARMAP